MRSYHPHLLPEQRFRIASGGLVAVALATRVLYVLLTPGYSPRHDDRAYDVLARAVARTGAYPLVNGYPTAYRPPGYTYFLGGVYWLTGTGHDSIVAARLIQCVLGAASVALLGWLARELFGRTAALCTMVLAAIYLPFIAVGASLLSEGQTVALELAATVLAVRWRRQHLCSLAGGGSSAAGGRSSAAGWSLAVGAGVAAGVLTLTRSNAFVVVPALILAVVGSNFRSRRAWAAAAVLLAVCAGVVAPWTIRNAVVMHSFIPVSDEAGGTLAGTYNPVSDHDRAAPAYWHLLSQIPTYQAATAGLADGPEPAFQAKLLHLALSYAENHPLYPAKVAVFNTGRLLGFESLSASRYTAGLAGITSPAVADACLVMFWAVMTMALAGLARSAVRRRVPAFVWVEMALLFATIALVNSETPRLRLPLDPFVILVAGGTLGTGVGRIRGRPSKPAGEAGPAGAN